jgi:hypothetical protein
MCDPPTAAPRLWRRASAPTGTGHALIASAVERPPTGGGAAHTTAA